jgi:outer membrane immunogenic protein
MGTLPRVRRSIWRASGLATLLVGASTPLAVVHAFAASPAPAAYSWTGFYVGANLGYGWANANDNVVFVDPLLPFTAAHSQTDELDRIIGGGQVGYNWQFNSNAVLGLEADWQSSGARRDEMLVDFVNLPFGIPPDTEKVTTNYESKASWFGTVRGRIGYAWDRRLFYATGGLAYGRISISGTTTEVTDLTNTGAGIFTSTTPFGVTRTAAGWTLGAGIESALADSWTWKLEYLYVDLGSIAGNFTPQTFGGETLTVKSRFDDNILRAGLDYRFK